MNRDILRFIPLALLVCAAAPSGAASAPVTELSGNGAVERLERMLHARNQMQLDMQGQLDRMASELNVLRGTVERNSFDINQMLERQRDIYKEIDGLRKTPKAATNSTDLPTPVSLKEAYSSNQEENTHYDNAVNLILKEKKYTAAIDAFNKFLTQYPNSVYKANTHYWLGQLYFSKSNLDSATIHFTEVNQIKDAKKRADALFKLGLIAEKKGDAIQASTIFKQVIKEFPATTLASQARKKLLK